MTAVMERIPGVVLAGGLSRRMGGGDKGLRELAGKAADTACRRAPGGASVAACDQRQWRCLAVRGAGASAGDRGRARRFRRAARGILAGLRWAARAAPDARFIVTAACDTPFFPEGFGGEILRRRRAVRYPVIVLAKSGEQVHPVFGLWPLTLADDLADALATGTRKVRQWAERHPHFIVEFPTARLWRQARRPLLQCKHA